MDRLPPSIETRLVDRYKLPDHEVFIRSGKNKDAIGPHYNSRIILVDVVRPKRKKQKASATRIRAPVTWNLCSQENRSDDFVLLQSLCVKVEGSEIENPPPARLARLSLDREIYVYREVIAKFKEIIGDESLLPLPKFVDASITDSPAFVALEDLSDKTYRMEHRWLDSDHVYGVLRALARFHSASYLVSHKFGRPLTEVIPGLTDSAFSKTWSDWRKQTRERFEGYADLLGSFALVDNKITSAFRKLLREDDFFSFADDVPSNVAVVTHNDLWLANILFVSQTQGTASASRDSDSVAKLPAFQWGEESSVPDCYFVDLGLSSYGLPTDDFAYFVLYSVPHGQRRRVIPSYLKYYHSTLQKYVSRHDSGGVKIPSLNDLEEFLGKSMKRAVVTHLLETNSVDDGFENNEFMAHISLGLLDELRFYGHLGDVE